MRNKDLPNCLCGGLLLGKDIFEDDGYFFLTKEAQKYLTKRIIDSLSVQTDEQMVEEIAKILWRSGSIYLWEYIPAYKKTAAIESAREIHSKVQAVYEARIQEAVRKECEAILKLYEDTGCVVEDESPQYSFWQTLNNRINSSPIDRPGRNRWH